MAVSSSPAYDQRVGITAADHLLFGDEIGNLLDLGLAGIHHQLMVLGIRRDYACQVILFQSSDAMHESFGARYAPIPDQALLVAEIRPPLFTLSGKLFLNIGRSDGGVLVQ